MKISVILPIYNVEDYIEECLDSLLFQSIGEENLEIILVDDCSTDNTANIIQENKHKFTNLIYYKLPVNQGSPGKPRNIGVEMATGDYIHFMDPDDTIEENTYEVLLSIMDEKDDFAMGRMVSVNEDGSEFLHPTFREHKLMKTYKSTNLLDTPFFAQVKIGVVLKLIRTSFYLNNEIKFVEDMKNGEDKIVDTLLYTKAQSFSYTPDIVYRYRNREEDANKSLTHQAIKPSIYNDIEAYNTCRSYYNDECLEFFKINALRSIFWKVLDEDFKELDENTKITIFKEIRNIILNYNKAVFKMYLQNEIPIINLIQKEEYQLAISYAQLLTSRRKYFYEGKNLERNYRIYNQFKKSKSIKLYRILSKMRKFK